MCIARVPYHTGCSMRWATGQPLLQAFRHCWPASGTSVDMTCVVCALFEHPDLFTKISSHSHDLDTQTNTQTSKRTQTHTQCHLNTCRAATAEASAAEVQAAGQELCTHLLRLKFTRWACCKLIISFQSNQNLRDPSDLRCTASPVLSTAVVQIISSHCNLPFHSVCAELLAVLPTQELHSSQAVWRLLLALQQGAPEDTPEALRLVSGEGMGCFCWNVSGRG